MSVLIVKEQNNKFSIQFNCARSKNIKCDLTECGCRINTFVWVSHQLKCIYVETPKAGCSSIKKAFKISLDPLHTAYAVVYFEHSLAAKIDLECLNDKNKYLFMKLLKFARENYDDLLIKTPSDSYFSMFNGCIEDALVLYPDYFSFSFVRNPIEKVISTWQMFCKSAIPFRTTQIETIFKKPVNKITLQYFIRKLTLINNHHWNLYVDYLPIKSRCLDFIGKLEHLSSDWDFLMHRLGLNIILPHENKSCKAPVSLTNSDISRLEEIYAEDFKIFKYKQGIL